MLPGRDTRLRESSLDCMSALVEALADGLQETMDIPFAIFGYSLGGTVGFELTRELRRRGQRLPVRLMLASRQAPHYPEIAPIAHLPDGAFVTALQTRYNAIPPQILADRELMAMFLPILRADFNLLETYRLQPEDPIPTPITAWVGTEDRTLTRDRVAAWGRHTTANFELHEVSAEHFFTSDPRLLQGISRALR